ncbi:MAG: 4'-phosphopantetheinyl transferase [Frankiaceae bacterium]
MIEAILPAEVSSAEAFEDRPDEALFPEEEAVVSNAVDRRRREFTTGRACARQALAALGVPPAPLLPGARREPLWPAGVVGSITHCDGYRAAAVARDDDIASIGIDAEPNEPLPDGVLRIVSLPEERLWLERLGTGAPGDACWDRLLFCLKESVFKAWYPLVQRELGFTEAMVEVDPAERTFAARLLVDGAALPDGRPLTGFTGRWLARDGLILTSIVVPA